MARLSLTLPVLFGLLVTFRCTTQTIGQTQIVCPGAVSINCSANPGVLQVPIDIPRVFTIPDQVLYSDCNTMLTAL